ncbi:hypothetical protein INR49_009191 [Caranx melampygus]|nr:hypothetical protein INR49_009191 [Caranx melampygus]
MTLLSESRQRSPSWQLRENRAFADKRLLLQLLPCPNLLAPPNHSTPGRAQPGGREPLALSGAIQPAMNKVACSRVDAKGQQFVGVQIVEGAQVWQAQEEFREEGGVFWTTLGDQ